jgi:hypothetical protein
MQIVRGNQSRCRGRGRGRIREGGSERGLPSLGEAGGSILVGAVGVDVREVGCGVLGMEVGVVKVHSSMGCSDPHQAYALSPEGIPVVPGMPAPMQGELVVVRGCDGVAGEDEEPCSPAGGPCEHTANTRLPVLTIR